MCQKVTCRKCQKATWSGCGQHVSQVMKGVPQSERCQGHQNDPKEPGFFARLFGKKQGKELCVVQHYANHVTK